MTGTTNWQVFYIEGLQLMQTAVSAFKRPEIFTPLIIYNITLIAIEKMYMGLLLFHGNMPYGHTIADIASAVKQAAGLDPLLEADLIRLDSMQQICSFDDITKSNVSPDDIPFFADVLVRVHRSVTESTGLHGD